MRKDCVVPVVFEGVEGLVLNGFNYQNVICSMQIFRDYANDLEVDVFKIKWGGAALQHDMSFICAGIKVELVSLLSGCSGA